MQNLGKKNGQGLIEYILVVVLMGILALGVVRSLGQKTQAGFTKATTQLSQQLGV
jgi:type II secretory pathway pseudopilin PulG